MKAGGGGWRGEKTVNGNLLIFASIFADDYDCKICRLEERQGGCGLFLAI